MLLLGNLALALLYWQRGDGAGRAVDRFTNTMVTALADRGVSLAPEVEAKLSDSERRLYSPRDIAREEDLAVSLLGRVSQIDQAGRIYRYETALGWARFRGGGQFEAEWSAPRAVEVSIWDDTLALLQQAGFPTDPPPEIHNAPDGVTITLRQYIGGFPVSESDAYVLLRYENDALVSLSGRWLLGAPLPADGEAPCPMLGAALLWFADGQIDAGDPVSYIEDGQVFWRLSTFGSDYICLTPAWRITADGRNYDIDAETGMVITTS